jgi:RHS repeat-associated protein
LISYNLHTNQIYPFGMIMPERSYTATTKGYRFAFNGKEQDNEVSGSGNTIAFEARIYDSRLGRFLSTDPWEKKYAWQTPYAYFKNSPISVLDFFGKGEGDDKKPKNVKHTVKKDETLNEIADKYHTTPADIANNTETWDESLGGYERKGYDKIYKDEVLTVPDNRPKEGPQPFIGPIEGATSDGQETPSPYGTQNIDENANPVRATGITGTASLGGGVSFELGLAYNFKDLEFGPYLTLEYTVGLDASIGFMHNKYSPLKGTGDLTLSDIEGPGQSVNLGLWIFDATIGGVDDGSSSVVPNVYYQGGLGGSVGTPVGATINKGETWIFIINQAE